MRIAELNIETGPVVVARLGGDIDMSNVGPLRDELSRATPNAALGLVLDLSEVDYLDSAGIHMMHRLREELRTHGQRLALVIAPDSLIHDTLRLAGVDWSDEIVPSRETGEQALLRASG